MVALPNVLPVTTPVPETDAIAGDELLHVPDPGKVVSLNVVARPKQTMVLPVIADGSGFTVIPVVI
jgi:hypothetical protein